VNAESVLDNSVRQFDVICVGDGAVNVAASISPDLRVALATAIADNTRGRALLASLRARNVELGAVVSVEPAPGLVFVRGGARQNLALGDLGRPLDLPPNWSAQVMFISGLSPFVAHSGALCKVARAARRAGSTVLVDVHADWHAWQGHDGRTLRMILREADVVWCTAADLFGIKVDLATLRSFLRESAVLVFSDGLGHVSATGPFGAASITGDVLDEVFVATICAELARPREPWERVLHRAQAASARRIRA
jgi:sugar/nucleoside kinase (ribokinase family)